MYDWISIIVALVIGFIGGLCAAGMTRAMREKTPHENEKKQRSTMVNKNKKVKRNIYVGNLAHDVTGDDLEKAFASFGTVVSAIVVRDKFTGKPKGFGFVAMPNQREAEMAITEMNGKTLKGKPLTVNEARPRGNGRPRHRQWSRQRNRGGKRLS